jgi:SpoVK/Ycf46/Vps4 family AAA+-type ATPase
LISSYLGSTSKNIRSLLEYAQSEPCVLFLDEFDSIAKARDDRNEIGELKRVVVSLLQNIDNLEDTILIAATNHVHLLDPAIGRRFHYKIELLPPEMTERKKIFLSLLRKFPFEDQEIDSLVSFSEGNGNI